MDTALVMIDFQMDYFPAGRMELVGAEAAAAEAQNLLHHCRQMGMPVVYLQHISDRPGATFFLPETDGIALHSSLEPLATETVLEKHYPNSFRETGLEELLRGQGIKRLVLCGMMSHMCVDASVRAAFDLGFSCLLAHDACATRDLQFADREIDAASVHGAFMAALGAVYARVMTARECIDLLSRCNYSGRGRELAQPPPVTV